MKASLRPLLFLLCFGGCATAADVVQEHMVISPRTIVFQAPSTDTTVSITHTCSCPFSWSATVHYAAPDTVRGRASVRWLTLGANFPASMSNDKPNVPLSFDRTKLLNDTANFPKAQDTATIIITSNAYGVDSIVVIAVK